MGNPKWPLLKLTSGTISQWCTTAGKRSRSVTFQYLCKRPTKCLSKLLNRVLRDDTNLLLSFTMKK